MADTKKGGPTYEDVWKTLSAIDVSDYTEDKNGLTYLSWAWAWGVMMDCYPQLRVEWHGQNDSGGNRRAMPDVTYYDGGTAMVGCTVRIGDEVERSMWLPVMDYRNKAIAQPDARMISDAKMRCLVKCFAMLGLGHYIYAGEELPRAAMGAELSGNSVDALISQIRDTGKVIEDSGITIDPSLKSRAAKAIKSKKMADLEAVLAQLQAVKN